MGGKRLDSAGKWITSAWDKIPELRTDHLAPHDDRYHFCVCFLFSYYYYYEVTHLCGSVVGDRQTETHTSLFVRVSSFLATESSKKKIIEKIERDDDFSNRHGFFLVCFFAYALLEILNWSYISLQLLFCVILFFLYFSLFSILP